MTNQVADATDDQQLRAMARRQAILFLLMLFTSSWLCVIDDGGDRAHARAAVEAKVTGR